MKTVIVMALVAMLAPFSAGCQSACPTALAEGVLVADGQSLVLQATSGETRTIDWPSGYSVRKENGRLTLVDGLGRVKAAEGDQIQVTGGLGTDHIFHACGDVVAVSR